MLIYSILLLLSYNAAMFRREKCILYSKQITSFLLLLLFLDFFLYLISSYVLGWNCLSLYLSFALLFLLRLIDYTSDSYYINKTRKGIKPYSNINNITLYLSRLILLIRSIITLIMSPLNSLLNAIFIKIINVIISTFTSTPLL